LLPAGLAVPNSLPQYTACHGEVQVTVTDGKISCVYNSELVYQTYTYYVRTVNGKYVCRNQVIEIWHTPPKDGPATGIGLRNPDSVRFYYRVEYANQVAGENGRVSFVEVRSGPNGVLVEVMTFLAVTSVPNGLGAAEAKEIEEL
jgi:hypothetical protein